MTPFSALPTADARRDMMSVGGIAAAAVTGVLLVLLGLYNAVCGSAGDASQKLIDDAADRSGGDENPNH